MIDLHTHTTASDGRLSPDDLVWRAAAAGVTVLSVTDHDTVAGCDRAQVACQRQGIAFVDGIEITAVEDNVDVHVLGYFVDRQSPAFVAFLAEQRLRRVDRVREMVESLRAFDIHLDADAILRPGLEDATRSAGRPWIARALVAGGHVADANEAFERWLGRGRPAFIPRRAASPADVIARIHDARGIASLAHPGSLARDEWLPAFASAGLDALEAFHTNHDGEATARYLNMAARLKLAVTGGSDYHGDEAHGGAGPGSVSLPREMYDRLVQLRADRAVGTP